DHVVLGIALQTQIANAVQCGGYIACEHRACFETLKRQASLRFLDGFHGTCLLRCLNKKMSTRECVWPVTHALVRSLRPVTEHSYSEPSHPFMKRGAAAARNVPLRWGIYPS